MKEQPQPGAQRGLAGRETSCADRTSLSGLFPLGLWAGALLDSAQINKQKRLLSEGPLQGKRPGSVIVLLVFIHPHFSYPLGVPGGMGRGIRERLRGPLAYS